MDITDLIKNLSVWELVEILRYLRPLDDHTHINTLSILELQNSVVLTIADIFEHPVDYTLIPILAMMVRILENSDKWTSTKIYTLTDLEQNTDQIMDKLHSTFYSDQLEFSINQAVKLLEFLNQYDHSVEECNKITKMYDSITYPVYKLVCHRMLNENNIQNIFDSNYQPCTPMSKQIAQSLVKAASQKIFANPYQSFLEIPVNSLDAYAKKAGQTSQVGKFGLGFFSIFYWLQDVSDYILINSVYTQNNTNTHNCQYIVMFTKNHTSLEYTFLNPDYSNIGSIRTISEIGVDVNIGIANKDFEIDNLIEILLRLDQITTVPILLNIHLDKYTVDNYVINSSTYSGDISDHFGIYINITSHEHYPFKIEFRDFALGIPYTTLMQTLLVPSISSKLVVTPSTTRPSSLELHKSGITNIRSNYSYITKSFKITKSGYFMITVADIGLVRLPLKYPYEIVMALPANTRVPASRDDIIIERPDELAMFTTVLKYLYFTSALAMRDITALNSALYMYMDYTAVVSLKLLIRNFINTVEQKYNDLGYYLFPYKYKELYVQIFDNFIASDFYNTVTLTEHLPVGRTDIFREKHVLFVDNYGDLSLHDENYTNAGTDTYIFVDQDYTTHATWIMNLALSRTGPLLIPMTITEPNTTDIENIVSKITDKAIKEFVATSLKNILLVCLKLKDYFNISSIKNFLQPISDHIQDFSIATNTNMEYLQLYVSKIYNNLYESRPKSFHYGVTKEVFRINSPNTLSLINDKILYQRKYILENRFGITTSKLFQHIGYRPLHFPKMYEFSINLQDLMFDYNQQWKIITGYQQYIFQPYPYDPLLVFAQHFPNESREISGNLLQHYQDLYYSTDNVHDIPLITLLYLCAELFEHTHNAYEFAIMAHCLRLLINYDKFGKLQLNLRLKDQIMNLLLVHIVNISHTQDFIKYLLQLTRNKYNYTYMKNYAFYLIENEELKYFEGYMTYMLIGIRTYLQQQQYDLYNKLPITNIESSQFKNTYEFMASQLINYIFHHDVKNLLDDLANISSMPQTTALNIIGIAINEGTTKPYWSAVLTELVQNSVDAIRNTVKLYGNQSIPTKLLTIDIQVYRLTETDISVTITDYIGISDDNLLSLLIPFVSNKTGQDTTGEIGSGFFNVYRESSHVIIDSVYQNRQLTIRDEPIKIHNRVIDLQKYVNIRSTTEHNRTSIQLQYSTDNISEVLTDINYFILQILSLIGDTLVTTLRHKVNIRLNGQNINKSSVKLPMISYAAWDLPTYISTTPAEFSSYILTKNIPFAPLVEYLNTIILHDFQYDYYKNILTYLSNDIIINFTRQFAKASQSRTQLNLLPVDKRHLIRHMEQILFVKIINNRELLEQNIINMDSVADVRQLKFGESDYTKNFTLPEFITNFYSYNIYNSIDEDQLPSSISGIINRIIENIMEDNQYHEVAEKIDWRLCNDNVTDNIKWVIKKWFKNKNQFVVKKTFSVSVDPFASIRRSVNKIPKTPEIDTVHFNNIIKFGETLAQFKQFAQNFIHSYWQIGQDLQQDKLINGLNFSPTPPRFELIVSNDNVRALYNPNIHCIKINIETIYNNYYGSVSRFQRELSQLTLNKLYEFNDIPIYKDYFGINYPAATIPHELLHALLNTKHDSYHNKVKFTYVGNIYNLSFDETANKIFQILIERGFYSLLT